jgi:hypothetical protein
MDPLNRILLAGVAATALVDLWAIARRRLFGTALPGYRLVGRWIAHMPRGRFRHAAIAAAAPLRGEGAIGWVAHYLIGIAFASLLFAAAGSEWFDRPTLLPALLVGIMTVAAPWFVMQPAMGAGLAARLTARPNAARIQSLITHGIFGVGLYAGAVLASQLLEGV